MHCEFWLVLEGEVLVWLFDTMTLRCFGGGGNQEGSFYTFLWAEIKLRTTTSSEPHGVMPVYHIDDCVGQIYDCKGRAKGASPLSHNNAACKMSSDEFPYLCPSNTRSSSYTLRSSFVVGLSFTFSKSTVAYSFSTRDGTGRLRLGTPLMVMSSVSKTTVVSDSFT